MKFIYNDVEYPVMIVKKRQNKNTYFRVKDDLTLYITTNSLVSDREIKRMIESNKYAIFKMYDKVLKKQEINEDFYYLGKKYDIVYVGGNTLEFGERKVFVGREVDIDKWLKKQAQIVFKEYFDKCYNSFKPTVPYPSLHIRKMKTRWGVCNCKEIKVTLNLELIKKDICCLEYVIFHELSHLIEPNHSNSFWKVVEKNYPNYKNVRKMLKE